MAEVYHEEQCLCDQQYYRIHASRCMTSLILFLFYMLPPVSYRDVVGNLGLLVYILSRLNDIRSTRCCPMVLLACSISLHSIRLLGIPFCLIETSL